MDERRSSIAEPAHGDARPRPAGPARAIATILAVGLIGLWLVAWSASLRRDRLDVGLRTWTPALPFLAGDFKVHIDHVARIQAAGIDPYHNTSDGICAIYFYPPMLGRLFAWVAYFDKATAAAVWQGAVALILSAGAIGAWMTRRRLGLDPLPAALLVAAVLYSSPALFAVERGQSDPMVIVPLLVSAWLLRKRSTWAEVACGALLGATAWLKYYPGACGLALLVLGRRRALASFVAVAALIGVVDQDGIRVALKQAVVVQKAFNSPRPAVCAWNHSLVTNWPEVGFVHRSRVLRRVPGSVATVLLILPAVLLVSRKVARSPEPSGLIYPYLLWLTAAATYGTPFANDYNLTALPIALVAVWDRRDRPGVQVLMGLSLVWLQPFWLPISPDILVFAKLATLYGVGACLASRALESAPSPAETGRMLFRPAFARGRTRPVPLVGGPAPGPESA